MLLREAIVQEALTWRETPYHHAAALKGIGCDCVGLVVGIARQVGCVSQELVMPLYSPEWHLHRSEELLMQTMHAYGWRLIPFERRTPGIVLVFQYGRVSSHTAVLVARDPDYIVHASREDRRVVHQRLDTKLEARVRGAYAFPGVALCD